MDRRVFKKALGIIVASQVLPFLFTLIGIIVGDSLIRGYLIGLGLDVFVILILSAFWLLSD